MLYDSDSNSRPSPEHPTSTPPRIMTHRLPSESLAQYVSKPVESFSTMIPALDDMLGGGVRVGCLYEMSGLPIGRLDCAVQTLLSCILQGKKALWISANGIFPMKRLIKYPEFHSGLTKNIFHVNVSTLAEVVVLLQKPLEYSLVVIDDFSHLIEVAVADLKNKTKVLQLLLMQFHRNTLLSKAAGVLCGSLCSTQSHQPERSYRVLQSLLGSEDRRWSAYLHARMIFLCDWVQSGKLGFKVVFGKEIMEIIDR